MAQPLQIEQLDNEIRASGKIDSTHALHLRRLIYASGNVTREGAETLFKLDQACSKKDPAFATLFVEALTDYFVWQSDPKGYVDEANARFLIDNVTADGHLETETELELVLNVVHWARQVPEELVTLIIDAVRQSVLLSRETPLGGNRPTRSIGTGDVAILRKALHAPAGDGSLLVTRREAELLFELNEATTTGNNDPEWSDFFARAIANHLMNPLDTPSVPTRDEAKHREKWLDQRGSIGQLLTGVGKALARGDVPVRSVFEQLDPFGAKAAKREAEEEARATKKRLSREQIDRVEAKWVAERILRDGTIDENERALLVFLKKESPAIDPALKPILDRVGL
jgi:hypothetical protein